MPLLPALKPLADLAAHATNAAIDTTDIAAARAQIREMNAMGALLTDPAPPAAAEIDHVVAIPDGSIAVRTYYPEGDGPFPIHMFLHGGGWWLGSLDESDNVCRTRARDAGCVVASVDYRLAPEAAFPGPVEDCYAALVWLAEHCDDLHLDPRRITIGGESAGGNLAAAVTLMSRDRGGPTLVGQILEIPCTDMTLQQPAIAENADAPALSAAELRECVTRYLADHGDARHAYASPLLASNLSGLPPALITAAELDPLRDDGIAYARRLREAGVDARLMFLEGQFHGIQRLAKIIPDEVNALRRAIADFLLRVNGSDDQRGSDPAA